MKQKIFVYIFTLCIYSISALAQSGADSMLNFIAQNKSRSALYLVQQDTVLARVNENKRMPLASTVKILVAIEFAKQSAAGIIREDMQVALKELEKYHLPFTDGNAHSSWLNYEKQKAQIKNDSIALLNVAQGMMRFSSNANTEYLMDLLGIDNVKNNLQLLGVTEHTPVYYLVSSLFMYQNPRKKKESAILKGIKRLNEEQYARYIYDMHNALKYDTVLKSKFNMQDLTENMQKMWSDRLPASNVKSYAQICNILNHRKYFDEKTYSSIGRVLESSIMDNPKNRELFLHAGMKGGSTMWVLTKAVYATSVDGTRIELCYFFNDLTVAEHTKLQQWMNDFELKILIDPNFRTTVAQKL